MRLNGGCWWWGEIVVVIGGVWCVGIENVGFCGEVGDLFGGKRCMEL